MHVPSRQHQSPSNRSTLLSLHVSSWAWSRNPSPQEGIAWSRPCSPYSPSDCYSASSRKARHESTALEQISATTSPPTFPRETTELVPCPNPTTVLGLPRLLSLRPPRPLAASQPLSRFGGVGIRSLCSERIVISSRLGLAEASS